MKKIITIILITIASVGCAIGLLFYVGILTIEDDQKEFNPDDYTQEELDKLKEEGAQKLEALKQGIRNAREEADSKIQELTDLQKQKLEDFRKDDLTKVITIVRRYGMSYSDIESKEECLKLLEQLSIPDSRNEDIVGWKRIKDIVAVFTDYPELEEKYSEDRKEIILIDQGLSYIKTRMLESKTKTMDKCLKQGVEIKEDLTHWFN